MDAAAFVPSEETEETSTLNPVVDSTESKKPPSKEAKLAALQSKLREAIEGEEYERAAKIRDQIKNITSEN